MKGRTLIDRLDVLRQRLDADTTSSVPAPWDPPPAMVWPEGPPRHSSIDRSILCETGACLLGTEISGNAKSDFRPSCIACGETITGVPIVVGTEDEHYCTACWGTVGRVRHGLKSAGASLPLVQNSANLKSDFCPVCGQPEHQLAVSPYRTCLNRCADPAVPWPAQQASGYLVSDGHEPSSWGKCAGCGAELVTANGWVSEAGGRYCLGCHAMKGGMVPDPVALSPWLSDTGGFSLAVMTAEESERAWFGTAEDWDRAFGLAMSPEYRRTVEGPDVAAERLGDGWKYQSLTEMGHGLVNRPADKVLAMATVAGHTFEGVGSDARCSCGRYWVEIKDCTTEHVDKFGYAHSGNLSEYELRQIEDKRKLEERFWEAVEGVSGGR